MKDQKLLAGFISFILFLVANFKISLCSEFYDITAKDIHGRDILMGDYFREKVCCSYPKKIVFLMDIFVKCTVIYDVVELICKHTVYLSRKASK